MIFHEPVRSTDGHREALFVREVLTFKQITWSRINIFIWNFRENYLNYDVETCYYILNKNIMQQFKKVLENVYFFTPLTTRKLFRCFKKI